MGDERPRGTDLYDQLTNSPHTRFHAAQMFHRYFLLPEKIEFWRDTYEHRCSESYDDSDLIYMRGVWNIALACMALSVKVCILLSFA